MARELLGMATDPNVSDSVKITAIRDALDRAGLKPVTAVDLDISTKPWERVFDRIAAGPREPALAIEGGILDDGTDTPVSESGEDEVVVGEIDDDDIDDYPLRFQRESESAEFVDVEIVAADYSDADHGPGSGTAYRDQDQSQPDDHTAPPFGPLGPNYPGGGMLSLQDAIEAASVMRQREAARLRNMRRR